MEQPTTIKILKKINLVAIGGGKQIIAIKWAFDYDSNYQSQVIELTKITPAEYGIAEYGIGEYTNGIALENKKVNVSGTGKVMQLGFETDIIDTPLSFQKIDIALKMGKTN